MILARGAFFKSRGGGLNADPLTYSSDFNHFNVTYNQGVGKMTP